MVALLLGGQKLLCHSNMQVSFFPFPAIARADRKTAELRNQKVEWFSSVQTERRNDRPRSPSISSRPQYEPPSSSASAAAIADNLLYPVTADFESAESILVPPSLSPPFLPTFTPVMHSRHSPPELTSRGQRRTDGRTYGRGRHVRSPLCRLALPRLARAHVINLDLRWNSEIVNHDKCSLQSFPTASSRTPSFHRVASM